MLNYLISLVVIFFLVWFPGSRITAAFDHGKVSFPPGSTFKAGQNPGIWHALSNGPNWADSEGWDSPQYYSTIQTGDINGDGRAELIARGADGIQAWSFDPSAGTWSQLPNGPDWSDAAGWDAPEYYSTIQTGDINGDGRAELIARGAGGIEAWNFDPSSSTWSQLPDGPSLSDAAGWDSPQYYSTIQTGDINGDGRAELIARGAGGIRAWNFDPFTGTWSKLEDGPSWSDAHSWDHPQYYSTIQTADIDGDGQAELLARYYIGIEAWKYDPTSKTWLHLRNGPDWSDANSWEFPEYYSTIQAGDINGDGRAEMIARGPGGILAWRYDPSGNVWYEMQAGPGLSDAAGWSSPEYYSTIQTGDINGDGRAELIARSSVSIAAWNYDPSSFSWSKLPNGPGWSDAAGWNSPQYYSTIKTADIDGDGQAELFARGVGGIYDDGFYYLIEGLSISHDGSAFLGQPTSFTAVIGAGTDVSYLWDFGDQQQGSGAVDSHAYTSTGTFTVTLTASNPVSSSYTTTKVAVKAIVYLPQIMR